jgi:hypothetical protein
LDGFDLVFVNGTSRTSALLRKFFQLARNPFWLQNIRKKFSWERGILKRKYSTERGFSGENVNIREQFN